MRTVLWTIGWIGVAIWTVFALVAFGFVGLVGDTARDFSGHVPGFPDELFSAPWIVDLMQRTGRLALFLVWLLGAAVILAVPGLLSLLFPRRTRTAAPLHPRSAAPLPGPRLPVGEMPPIIGRHEPPARPRS
jgi:hypothetical protein